MGQRLVRSTTHDEALRDRVGCLLHASRRLRLLLLQVLLLLASRRLLGLAADRLLEILLHACRIGSGHLLALGERLSLAVVMGEF